MYAFALMPPVPLDGTTITLSLGDLAAPLIVGLVLWVIKTASATRKEIVGSVTMLSTKMAEVTTGFDAHIKQDDERHIGIQRESDAIWRAMGQRKGDHL